VTRARGAGLVLALAALFVPLPTSAQSAWSVAPAVAHPTGIFRNRLLQESSGVAPSRRHPGVLWTFNDSDNPPYLFATDTLGRDLGTFRVTGAENVDWEAMALARCGGSSCLYLADTGDNFERRSTVRLYRFPEPAPPDNPVRLEATARAEAVEVRYPGGARDVEAMFVDANGDVYLISKGLLSPVRLYRVPASAWQTGRVVADSLGSLPIDSGSDLGRLVTDAALAPDGVSVAVRTYREIYFFRLEDGRLHPASGSPACSLGGLEVQGEGVGWLDSETLVLTSERGYGPAGTVSLARCPHR
jgi:hypothetical protein